MSRSRPGNVSPQLGKVERLQGRAVERVERALHRLIHKVERGDLVVSWAKDSRRPRPLKKPATNLREELPVNGARVDGRGPCACQSH